MDHLSFIFSLLLIVSVATTTLGSAIKAKNINGEELEPLLPEAALVDYPEMAANRQEIPTTLGAAIKANNTNGEELEALSSDAALVNYPEMAPNRQELEARALLEPSNYLNPRMSTRDEENEKEKRLVITVIAGIALGIGALTNILVGIGSVTRKIAIGIDNESGFNWQRPSHYFYSGWSDQGLPSNLNTGKAVLYPARKTNGLARGVVGVVAFYVPSPIKSTVAVMFSVPFDYNWYENWWNVKLYKGYKRADYGTWVDLYYHANPFKANGWHERDLGHNLKFRGVMASSGRATLEIHVTKK